MFRDAPMGQAAFLYKTGRVGLLGPLDTETKDTTPNSPDIRSHWNQIQNGGSSLYCLGKHSWTFQQVSDALLEYMKRFGPIRGLIKLPV
jgi:hypothetical protein